MRSWIISVLVVFGLVGCGPAPVPTQTPSPVNSAIPTPSGSKILTVADTEKKIDLTVGQSLVIDLESNASTGYRWNLVGQPQEAVLKLIRSDYREPQTQGDMTGVPGQETWQFQAIGRGTTTVKLAYAHSWEIAQSTEKEFTVTIQVQ